MRAWRTIGAIMAFMAVSCTGTGMVNQAWSPPPDDPQLRAVWMVHYLTELADHGGVDGRDDLAGALHSAVTLPAAGPASSTFPECKTATGQVVPNTHDRFAVEGTWFKSMPGGVERMSYPGYFINGPGTTGAPLLTYDRETTACTGLRGYNKVTLTFDNLPAFACITGDKLVAANNGIKQGVATDGFIVFSYAGKVDQETFTSIGFSGRFGGPCVISAEVTRHLQSGYRERRAEWKLRQCEDAAAIKFCRATPPPPRDTWPVSQALLEWNSRLFEAERRSCKPLDDYLAAEPENGPEVGPVPFRRNPMCRR